MKIDKQIEPECPSLNETNQLHQLISMKEKGSQFYYQKKT